MDRTAEGGLAVSKQTVGPNLELDKETGIIDNPRQVGVHVWCRCGHSDHDHQWGDPVPVRGGGTLAKLGRCRHRDGFFRRCWCPEFRDSGRTPVSVCE